VPGVGSSLNSTDVELNWFGTPGCGIPTGPNFDRTIVVLTAGLCHRECGPPQTSLLPRPKRREGKVPHRTKLAGVPDAPSTGSGYRALCSGDGKGVLQFCSAADCSNCELAAPFNDKECEFAGPFLLPRLLSGSFTPTHPLPLQASPLTPCAMGAPPTRSSARRTPSTSCSEALPPHA